MGPIKFDLGDYGQSVRMNDGGLLDAIGNISANRRKMRREDASDQIASRNADLQEKRFGLDTDRYKSDVGETKRKNKQEAIAAYHGGIQMGASRKAAFARSGLADFGFTPPDDDDDDIVGESAGPAQAGPQGPAPERRENALDAMKAPPLHGDTPVEPPPMKFDATAGNYGHADRPEAGEPAPRTPTRLPVQGRRLVYVKDESGNRIPFDPNVVQDERLRSASLWDKLGAGNKTLEMGATVGRTIAEDGGTVGQAGQAVTQFGAAEMRGDESEAARLASAEQKEKDRALREKMAADRSAAARLRAATKKDEPPTAARSRMGESAIDNASKIVDESAKQLQSAKLALTQLKSGHQSLAFTAIGSQITAITGALNDSDAKRLLLDTMSTMERLQAQYRKATGGEAVAPEVIRLYREGLEKYAIPALNEKYKSLERAVYERLAYQPDPAVAVGARTAVNLARGKAGFEPYSDQEWGAYTAERTAARKGTPVAPAAPSDAAPQVSAKAAAMIDALMAKRKAPK